jgi:PAS domain S-box-containing protein
MNKTENDHNRTENDSGVYRAMVDSIWDCAIFMLDVDGRVCTWNAGAERIKGYRAPEILGRHFSVFYPHEKSRQGKPEQELLAAAAQNRFEDEGWRIRQDRSRFWAHIVITAMRDEAGQLTGFVKLTRDLTGQKKVEDELRRSLERFQNVVESAPNMFVMINRAGRIEMVNLQVERVFGYTRDELIGQPVEMLIPAQLRGQHRQDRMSYFAQPMARPMGAGRDLNAVKKDGAEFPVEIGLNPVATREGTMVLAAIVDITERKAKEAALLRSETRFRCAMESAPAAMVMVGQTGKIDMVNRQLELLFGYSRDELLGQSIELLIPERFRTKHSAFRAPFFSEPEQRPMGAGRDLYGLRKDGTEIPVEIGLNPIETEDGLMVLAAIINLSERKLDENQIQCLLYP